MANHPKARVVPYSSVVGSSVTLHDPETERVIGQLAILSTGGDTPDDRKQRQILVAEDTARRINLHDDLVAELSAAIGYMRNAKIDLETGATKATAIRTIEGGIKRAEAALAKAEAR